MLAVLKGTVHPLLNVNFTDSNNSFNFTNKVGNYTFSVLSGIKKAIVQSLVSRDAELPGILYFYVLKAEQRKLEFFKKFFRDIFTKYQNEYVDGSDNKYNLIYFW